MAKQAKTTKVKDNCSAIRPEDAPTLAYECGNMRNILGYEEWT